MAADHTSGAKLASAYIEATVKVKDAKEQVKASLEGAAPAAREAGGKIGEELHAGILSYTPSSGALNAWADSLADSQKTAVHRALSNTTDFVVSGDTVARAIADGSLKSFESGGARTAVEAAAASQARTHTDTFLAHLGEGMLQGVQQAGDSAGDSFAGRFVTRTATKLAEGGGIRSLFHSAVEDAGLEKEGEAASESFWSSFKGKAGGLASSIGDFDLAEHLGKLKENAKGSSEALEGVSEEGAAAGGIIARLAGAGELLLNPYVAAGAAILAVVASLAVVADKLDDIGEKWEEVNDQIQISTGGSAEAVEALNDQVTKVAGNVSTPLEQTAANIADASSVFNQSGDDVGKLGLELSKTQAVFGKFDDVSVARTFDAFGIKNVDDQIAGLNTIKDGYQAARIPLDQMSSALERVAPAANQFGLSFKDSAGYLTEFAKSGIEPERAALTLTTALEKLRNPKVEEFLSGKGITVDKNNLNGALMQVLDTVTKLQQADPNSSVAQDIAAKVFGEGQRGGGAAVQQALPGGKGGQLDATDLTKPFDAISQNIDQTYDATKHAAGEWAEFKNQVDIALKPAGEAIHTFVDKTMTGLVQFFESHKAEIASFFSFMGEAAVRAGQGIVITFGAAISSVGGLGVGLSLLIDGIANIVQAWGVAEEDLPSWLGGNKDAGEQTRHAADDIHDFGNKVDSISHTLIDTGTSAYDFATGPMDDLATNVGNAGNNVKDTNTQLDALHQALGNLNNQPPPNIKVNTDDATQSVDQLQKKFDNLKYSLTGGIAGTAPDVFDTTAALNNGDPTKRPPPVPGAPPQVYDGLTSLILPPQQHAEGGEIWGAGPKGKDSVPIWAAPGEHMWTAAEVEAVGGQGAMYHLRALAKAGGLKGYADGGAIDVEVADSLAGTPYSKGNRADCSGMVGRVVEGATGIGGGLPTTKNMESFLAARGFKDGVGGLGQITVGWYDRGPNPNDGHAAMTLSNGQNAESGPDGRMVIGGDAAGGGSAEFDHHMFLSQTWGQGPAGAGGDSGGGATAAQTQSAADNVTRAQGSVSVATQKLQEAQDAPLGKGKDAQANHDRAVTDAQAKLDAANRDLDSAKQNQADLANGDPQAVVAARKALTDALNQQTDAQAKLDAVMADPKHKPSDETAAQNRLAEATTKVSEAQGKLTDAQSKSKPDATHDIPGELGKVGSEFFKDNLPQGFSDPTTWSAVKDAGTLLKIFGAHTKDKTQAALLGAAGDAFGGNTGTAADDLAALFAAKPDPPKVPNVGDGTNPPPAPAGDGGNVDNSVTFHGDIASADAARSVVGDVHSRQARTVRQTVSPALVRSG